MPEIHHLRLYRRLAGGFFLRIMVFLLLSCTLRAQTIEAARRTDWSGSGPVRDIPTYQRKLNVTDHGLKGDGKTDNAAEMKRLLKKVSDRRAVVYFPEGTYYFSSMVRVPPHTIIRGAGPERTRFLFEFPEVGYSGAFTVARYRSGDDIPVRGGLQKGSTTLVVPETAKLTEGDVIDIDQENNPDVMYTRKKWKQNWAQRAFGQLLRVKNRPSLRKVSTRFPLNETFDPSLNPTVRRLETIERVGFEQFGIELLNGGDKFTFYFKQADHCWLKNVHSYNTVKAHVALEKSVHCQVIKCRFDGSFRHDGGGYGYGVKMSNHTTGCLVENSVFTDLRHSMLVHLGANGNVFGYNYSKNRRASEEFAPPDISVHGHYPFMNLFEGNVVEEIESADYWGPSGPGITFFRNQVTEGSIIVSDHSIKQNIVGNELIGRSGDIVISDQAVGTLARANVIRGELKKPVEHLRDSLYRTRKPGFLARKPMPVFGPSANSGDQTIPARERFQERTPFSER